MTHSRELTKKEFTEVLLLVELEQRRNASLIFHLDGKPSLKKELRAHILKRNALMESIEGKLMDQYVSLYGQED